MNKLVETQLRNMRGRLMIMQDAQINSKQICNINRNSGDDCDGYDPY